MIYTLAVKGFPDRCSRAKVYLGYVQVGSYRYRSLIEGLYTLQKPYGSPNIL